MDSDYIFILIMISIVIIYLIAYIGIDYIRKDNQSKKDFTNKIEKNIQPDKFNNWIISVLVIKLILIFKEIITCCVSLFSFEYAVCNWVYIPLLIIILFKFVATFMLIGYKKKGFYFLCLAEVLSLIPLYFITKSIYTAYNSGSLIADIIFVNPSSTNMISFWVSVAKSFIWIGIIWEVLQIKRKGVKGWNILK